MDYPIQVFALLAFERASCDQVLTLCHPALERLGAQYAKTERQGLGLLTSFNLQLS